MAMYNKICSVSGCDNSQWYNAIWLTKNKIPMSNNEWSYV